MRFRMTWVHPNDRRYQLILWREYPSAPLVTYELATNTYGLRSSPYISIRTLLELAERERSSYPRAAAVLENDIYVNECLTGASSLGEAQILKTELQSLIACGGYELRKWISNEPELLKDIPLEHLQGPYEFHDPDNPPTIPVLVVFKAKAFIQRLWMSGLNWDDPLNQSLSDEWLLFVQDLENIKQLSIPRRILPADATSISLHGFCDASEAGYAAVVYLRTESSSGHCSVHFLISKSKIAPIRTRLTIPKLELQGAVLLTKLIHHVTICLQKVIVLDAIHSWTDSKIVLAWIKTPPHLLQTFEANRVSQITSSDFPSEWHHVPGSINPSDCASRGLSASSLLNHDLWWSPSWLTETPNHWPIGADLTNNPIDSLPGLRLIGENEKKSILGWAMEAILEIAFTFKEGSR
ncbi:uncharacterized protein LOC131845775 [Achroia grisella]|uniref:uncharacterized protein LOC131845775 n=1 Tax=Achroia grisella TaxID=688607 RepID=UPI0027D34FBB|nr:uncharacterized protein LOC131845775 [Achroia grisella]